MPPLVSSAPFIHLAVIRCDALVFLIRHCPACFLDVEQSLRCDWKLLSSPLISAVFIQILPVYFSSLLRVCFVLLCAYILGASTAL